MTFAAYSRQFKNLVTVKTPDGDIEDFVDTEPTWSIVTKQWAEIVPYVGDELIEARKIYPRASHRVRMRWTDKYSTSRTRFEHNGRTYHVGAARNVDDRHRIWEFSCSEETD